MDREPRLGIYAALAVIGALIGTLAWLSMFIAPWKLVTGLLDSAEHLERAEKRLSAGLLKDARYETLAGDASANRARDGLRAGGPVFDLVESVPSLGDALGEVEHFVKAAELSSEAALGTLDVAQNALRGPNKIIVKDPDDPDGGSQIRIERIEEIAETVGSVRGSIAGVGDELRAVNLDKVPGRIRGDVREAIEKAEDTDELLADAEAGLEILPGFLGEDGPRTYFFGMQNSGEQRGSGGALLQFKIMSISDGKPRLLEETGGSIYDIDRNRQQLTIPLPDDAWYVANIPDAQRFGNANWSPDWPLSAKLTLDYAYASPGSTLPPLDGAFAVDPVVIKKLIPGTGPYRTKAGNRISSEKVLHFLLYKAYAAFPVPAVRRIVLGQVVDGFYEGLLKPDHPADLVKGFGDSLAEKHMQVWLADPKEQRFIERMNWDGSIQPAKNSDYLYWVEQNVGGNKLDYFATNEVSTRVALGGSDADVSTEIRTHNGVFLPQPRWSMGDSGPRHKPMWNLYVPGDAELKGAEVAFTSEDGCDFGTCHEMTPPPAVWSNGLPPTHLELGKKVWSTTLEIVPNGTGSVRFDYEVPGVVRTVGKRKVYRLVVQHQPRLHKDLFDLRITLPEGAGDVRAKGFTRDGRELVWEKRIEEDIVLEVSWLE